MIVAIEIGKINAIGVVLQEVRQPDFEVKPISKIIEEYPLPIELVQTAMDEQILCRTSSDRLANNFTQRIIQKTSLN